MLEFSEIDLARLDILMKALKRGKYELEGEEILAFGQAFVWVATTHERIKSHLIEMKNNVRDELKIESEKQEPQKKSKK